MERRTPISLRALNARAAFLVARAFCCPTTSRPCAFALPFAAAAEVLAARNQLVAAAMRNRTAQPRDPTQKRCSALALHFSPPRRAADRSALLRGFGLGRRVIALGLASAAAASLLRARPQPPPVSLRSLRSASLPLCRGSRASPLRAAVASLRAAHAACFRASPYGGCFPRHPLVTRFARLFTFVNPCCLNLYISC